MVLVETQINKQIFVMLPELTSRHVHCSRPYAPTGAHRLDDDDDVHCSLYKTMFD